MSFLNSQEGSTQSLANIFLVGAVLNNVGSQQYRKMREQEAKRASRV
jgi:hypothetical protein